VILRIELEQVKWKKKKEIFSDSVLSNTNDSFCFICVDFLVARHSQVWREQAAE
jgi:hypothetical protein